MAARSYADGLRSDRSELIAFLGIDGSGKTTQAQRLVTWLGEQGRRATYHRVEGGRSELDALARRLGKVDADDLFGARSSGLAQSVIRWKSMRAAAELWAAPEGFVVLDRFAWCQFAAVRMQGLDVEPLVRAMFAEFPAPDLCFFVALEPEEAERRVARRGRDRDSRELLQRLDAAYRQLPEFASAIVLDGARSPDAVEQDVRRAVSARYPGLA